MKEIRSFVHPDGKLKLSQFSMGIDCPDIHNVIHFGSPATRNRMSWLGWSEEKIQNYGANMSLWISIKNYLFYEKEFCQEAMKFCRVCDKRVQ